jgi:valyl-tRNA synthetase
MDGYRVLWVPGTDHAGIAMKEREKSNQYEEKLRTLNLSLEQLREIE